MAGSIPDGVITIFHGHNPSGLTMPPTEYFLGRSVRLTTLSPSCADCLEIWRPESSGTLRACPRLYRNRFNVCCVGVCCPNFFLPYFYESTSGRNYAQMWGHVLDEYVFCKSRLHQNTSVLYQPQELLWSDVSQMMSGHGVDPPSLHRTNEGVWWLCSVTFIDFRW